MARKTTSKQKSPQGVVIYQAKSGAIELRGDFEKETMWATQADIARIFDVTPQNITIHLKNIYREGELSEKATCKESLQVQKEGNRDVVRKLKSYNLDVLIAAGYRVNSSVGTRFRQWATKTLREHITKGYTLNRKRIAGNHEAFMRDISAIQSLLPEHVALDPKAVLELVKEFAITWVSLDAYDKQALVVKGASKKRVSLTSAELTGAIADLKGELMRKGEASDLFASPRERSGIEGIVGNVMQSFGGKAVYPSLEEKAAHLLYFMVKNHPFTDGNKRSGAFAFVWFLRKTGVKGRGQMNPAALTVLTLLIAESDPKNKEQMIALVTTLLS